MDFTLEFLLAQVMGASIPILKIVSTVDIFVLHLTELARYGIFYVLGLTLYNFK